MRWFPFCLRSARRVVWVAGCLALVACASPESQSERAATTPSASDVGPTESQAESQSGSMALDAVMPQLVEQVSGVEERLQAVSAVDDQVVWASGVGGVWVRTLDGGESWERGGVEGHSELQFRDVHAVSAEVAYLLSAGPGPASRVFKTIDGGVSWRELAMAPFAESFWDCFDFWDGERGLLFGDSVRFGESKIGQLELWRTLDGQSWSRLENVPAALDGEGGFAASGGCLETRAPGEAVFVTGASDQARRFVTRDWGDSWQVQEIPLPSGEAKGATSTVGLAEEGGVGAMELVFGGDLGDRESAHVAVVASVDGGETWTVGARPGFPGPVYGAATAATPATAVLVAVGPMGAAVSFDRGQSWLGLAEHNYWSVDFAGAVGWMVGPEGRITRVRFGS